jgi:hypothetical protein
MTLAVRPTSHYRGVGTTPSHAVFYLADNLHTLIRVKAFERSTGFPDVGLEVRF